MTPSAASAAAMAKPMPAVEPDTTAVFPLRSRSIFFSLRVWFLSGSGKGGSAFDFRDFVGGEFQFARAHNAFGLLSVARANDGSGDGGMTQRPGDGHFAGSAAVTRADLAKAFDEFKVFRKGRFAKFRIAAAKIVGGQGGGAFAGHRAREKSGSHGSVVDHADSLLLAIRKNLGFNFPANDGVGRLQRSDGSEFLGALDLSDVKVGHANKAHFAFCLQRGESLPGFFDSGFVVLRRPVHLVEIDGVDLEAAETVFAFAANGNGTELFPDFAFLVPAQNAFRKNVGARTAPFLQRASDDFLGVAQAVNGGGVDPVDAELQRAVNCGDGIGVVLRTPGKFPATATESPSAKADARNVDVGVSQFSRFHSNPLTGREADFPGGESGYFIFYKLDEDTAKRLEGMRRRERDSTKQTDRNVCPTQLAVKAASRETDSPSGFVMAIC